MDVTDWVELGTTTLHNARKQQGLSYEAMGRKLNVAAKTWERYEKAGRVPRHMLRNVAEALDLEIDWPTRPDPITVKEPGASRPAEAEDAAGRELRILVEALLRAEGIDPDEVLRDARLGPEEPERGVRGREAPGEAA